MDNVHRAFRKSKLIQIRRAVCYLHGNHCPVTSNTANEHKSRSQQEFQKTKFSKVNNPCGPNYSNDGDSVVFTSSDIETIQKSKQINKIRNIYKETVEDGSKESSKNKRIYYSSKKLKKELEALKRNEDSSKMFKKSEYGRTYVLQRGDSTKDASPEPKSTYPLKRFYIGIVTPKNAESFVCRNTGFRVYHAKEIDKSEDELKLYIVYKSSRGDFYHYQILERYDKEMKEYLLGVECGDDDAPQFVALGSLIKFYSIYVSLHSYTIKNGLTADAFPWWLQVKNASRY